MERRNGMPEAQKWLYRDVEIWMKKNIVRGKDWKDENIDR